MKDVLEGFASGRSRCMYCGDNQGTDVDHYEPLAAAPLRTFVWKNHLLACSGCNSHFKRDTFPKGSGGVPLLLDPTVDDPFDHLALALSVGRYAPLTERGEATIEICQLNRDILSRGRQVAYDTLTVILEAWIRAHDSGDDGKMVGLEKTIREQPFADVIHAMLRYAHAPGAPQLFADRSHLLPILADQRLRARLLS
ncbi:HNH endonuclease [Kibdelosporangium aridum]|uniref:HNH endonuclease n=1 Tax=Kibdelosporangium aridum TaxID=2030 RepID=UPI000F789C55|nr:HNH endonuclease [Kibdelosporangium aridum]